MERSKKRAFQELVAWQIGQGTHGLVPCGTTGESPALHDDEARRIIALCVEVAKGRAPVIAGTGTNSTGHTIELTRQAKEAGADAALIVCPYYNKPTQEGLFQHFKTVHDAVDLPIIIYNIPGRSAVDMTNATMARLAKLPNIVGVKDATNDLARPLRMRREIGAGFCLLSGEDATAVAYLAQGGDGCISVTANVAPRLCSEMHEAWQRGDVKTVREINERLIPLHDALFAETSPAPVKYAASLLGRCTAEVRQPLWATHARNAAEGAAGDARRRPPQLMRTADRYVAQNRRARHDYLIEDTIEAGVVLRGTEVKVLRQGQASITEAYADQSGGELFLVNANIPEYAASAHFNHQPRRPRKLLLHRKQMNRLLGAIQRDGITVVPLSIYFNERGRAKVELGLARGKRKADKRQAEKQRDWQRSRARILREQNA